MPKDKAKILNLFDEFSIFMDATDIPSKVGGEIFDEIINRGDILRTFSSQVTHVVVV
ncbi:hypothetical protein M1271_01985 [Patescibacteria group bacterium]|nr:hypothetical protein [Patescibacteria group bacterium]MCL5798314.1 hypothetical protein [Patescibacteria group bacterium]